MTMPKTSRPFQQRTLDTFDRSRIREVAASAPPKRLSGLKRRYATLMLGASLAVGGAGIPMKFVGQGKPGAPGSGKGGVAARVSKDLLTAQSIAREVTSGVQGAVGVIGGLAPDKAQKMSLVTEKAREDFFRTEIPFGTLIYTEAVKNDLSPELVAAVVKTESQFKPTAKSRSNAQGLMQLVPRTGKWMGANNLMNPAENVRAGTKYLKYLHERFEGDQTMIIAAYNAGEGNVRKFGGVPPFQETRNYVSRVTGSQRDFEQQLSRKVTADQPVDLSLPEAR